MNDEIEIDLRKTILTIASGWKWIVGTALVAGVIALVVSLLLPTKFEAQAIVAVTNPQYIANFDPRYQTVDPTLTTNKNFLDLANSDEIIQQVIKKWNDPEKDKIRLDDFRNSVAKASNGSDTSIITLTVNTTDAIESANLANYWADLFTKRANDVYGGDDPTQLVFFTTQLDASSKALDAASQSLADFQKRNITVPLTNQLNSLLNSQNEVLQKQRVIRQSQEDARSQLAQISSLPQDSKLNPANQLNWTILSAKFYAASSSVQIQIPSTLSGDNITVADQMKLIQGWISALDAQYQSSQDSLKGIEDQITSLQGQIQALDNEQKRLTQARDLASETYVTLSHKTVEVQISQKQQIGNIRIAALAVVPNSPVSKQVARNVIFAVLIMFFISIVGLLIKGIWNVHPKN